MFPAVPEEPLLRLRVAAPMWKAKGGRRRAESSAWVLTSPGRADTDWLRTAVLDPVVGCLEWVVRR